MEVAARCFSSSSRECSCRSSTSFFGRMRVRVVMVWRLSTIWNSSSWGELGQVRQGHSASGEAVSCESPCEMKCVLAHNFEGSEYKMTGDGHSKRGNLRGCAASEN
jgi:hypothetical protein